MSEKSIALPITGMTCANCAANIERSLKKMEGIEEVAVNFASEKANVRYDPNQATVNDLIDNIQRQGVFVDFDAFNHLTNVTEHFMVDHHFSMVKGQYGVNAAAAHNQVSTGKG